MICKSCGKRPAVFMLEQGSVPLCTRCNLEVSAAAALDFNVSASRLNASKASLHRSLGLPIDPPLQLVPIQPVALGDTVATFHNITIHGSNHGIVNTGHLEAVDIAVGVLHRSGEGAAGRSLRKLVEAVESSAELNEEARTDVLELLAAVSEEATKPRHSRRSRVALRLAGEIGSLVSGVASLAELTKISIPIILSLFS